LCRIVTNENLATLVKCAKFSNFSRETLDNKPITFVRKRVKTRLRQCRIPKFSGGEPRPKGREWEGGRREREKRGWGGEGRGCGSSKGRGGTEGLKGREGKRRKRRRGRGEEFGPPDVPDRSTPLYSTHVSEMPFQTLQQSLVAIVPLLHTKLALDRTTKFGLLASPLAYSLGAIRITSTSATASRLR
jgi:hypothetical protein